jgi:hypothetical protein
VLGGGTASTASKGFECLPFFTPERLIIGLGYLTTVLRFSHGVALLHGYETERVKSSAVPSSSPGRLYTLALFMSVLSILLYLMAVNIFHVRVYLGFAMAIFILDFIYILRSGVVRGVSRRPFRLWKDTVPSSPARAAVQWLLSDIALCAISVALWFCSSSAFYDKAVSFPGASIFFSFAGRSSYAAFTLFLMALFGLLLLGASVLDYAINSTFYFGGKGDRRCRRFVSVCSPPRGEENKDNNIRRVQWYCKELMESRKRLFHSEVTPFAPHAFFPYFLGEDAKERILGRRCALAFLAACDAVYIYVPFAKNSGISRLFRKALPDVASLPSDVQSQIDEAKQLGLEMRYIEWSEPPDKWNPASPGPLPKGEQDVNEKAKFVEAPLRRVFVCTPLRGTWNGNVKTLEDNFRITLQCCRDLVLGEDPVAPFAPQVFYPSFWSFLKPDKSIDETRREVWFIRSLEVLKLCDAVYFYTKDGLSDPESMSEGMRQVMALAESLGLESIYMRLPELAPNWQPVVPDFVGMWRDRPSNDCAQLD